MILSRCVQTDVLGCVRDLCEGYLGVKMCGGVLDVCVDVWLCMDDQ